MLHAEVNLCSLFKRGEAKIVATTTMPCTACMQTLCAYGIKEVYYRDVYQQSDAPEIAETYDVKLMQVADFPHAGGVQLKVLVRSVTLRNLLASEQWALSATESTVRTEH